MMTWPVISSDLARRASSRRARRRMPPSDGLPQPRAGLPASWGTEDHRKRAEATREKFKAEGAQVPRFTERVDAAGNPTPPPPPPWFTLVAAIFPAIPVACFVPVSTMFIWLPVWIAAFYLLPRPLGIELSPMLFVCLVVTYRALSHEGWSGVGLYLLTPILGFLMNLVESALWDTAEPFLVGQPGFGAGTTRVRQVGSGAGGASSQPVAKSD